MKNNQSSQRQQVLIAADPNDQQAFALAEELRALGISVIFAETVEQASEADQVSVCIVVLRQGVWRTTPVVRTAMRSNPRYMIPVLAESMLLPPASWATDPVTIQEPLTATVRELVALMTRHWRTEPGAARENRPDTTATLTSSNAFYRPDTRQRRRIRYLSLLIVLLLGAGFLVYYWPHLALPTNITGKAPNIITTNFLDRPYAATVPGPGCDLGLANWAVGDNFKMLVTPTVGKTSTPPAQNTPTPQVVFDNSTATTCQQDGLLVKHNDHFDVYASVFFAGRSALPRHFKTQITATAVSISNSASFALGVRDQSGAKNNSGYDSGYGDDTITVDLTGRWDTQRYNDSTDQVDVKFTTGFIQPAKTITLAAVVDGPLMIFSLNGQQVTTVVDPTYPASYGISFGVSDPDAKGPPSVLFSHFTYTPLPETSLTTNAAVATATAQAAKDYQTPYTAAVPGFGCDKGVGQWQPVAGDDDTTTRCLSQGLEVSQGKAAKFIGSVAFYGLNGNFPANYKVDVQIDLNAINGGCAGVTTRVKQPAGYGFFVCADGSWQITRYDSEGTDHQIAGGNVAQHSTYSLEAISNGPVQSLSLNGVKVSSVTDKTLTTTEHIDLSLLLSQDTAGAAVFSHFVFAPLP